MFCRTFFLSNRFCSVSSKSGQTVSYFIFCHRNSAFYHDYSVILDQIPSLAQIIAYFIIVSMFKDLFSFPCGQNLSTFNSVISMALSQGPLPYLARYLAVYNRLIQYLDLFHNIVLAFSEKLVVKPPNFEIRLFITFGRSYYEVIEFYFAIRIGHGFTRRK